MIAQVLHQIDCTIYKLIQFPCKLSFSGSMQIKLYQIFSIWLKHAWIAHDSNLCSYIVTGCGPNFYYYHIEKTNFDFFEEPCWTCMKNYRRPHPMQQLYNAHIITHISKCQQSPSCLRVLTECLSLQQLMKFHVAWPKLKMPNDPMDFVIQVILINVHSS